MPEAIFFCKNCPDKHYKPFTPKDVEQHLLGNKTVGTYPLVNGRYCSFAVIDLDEDDWSSDAKAILECAERFNIPAYPEISRSGPGHPYLDFLRGLGFCKRRKTSLRFTNYSDPESDQN